MVSKSPKDRIAPLTSQSTFVASPHLRASRRSLPSRSDSWRRARWHCYHPPLPVRKTGGLGTRWLPEKPLTAGTLNWRAFLWNEIFNKLGNHHLQVPSKFFLVAPSLYSRFVKTTPIGVFEGTQWSDLTAVANFWRARKGRAARHPWGFATQPMDDPTAALSNAFEAVAKATGCERGTSELFLWMDHFTDFL